MPASTTAVFGEPDDFRAAFRNEGNISLFTIGPGRFLARLTKVELYRLRLAAVEEYLPRIGFLAVPAIWSWYHSRSVINPRRSVAELDRGKARS